MKRLLGKTVEKKDKKIIIVGDSAFAEVAYEYFSADSPYEVAAFAVEREFLKRSSLFGLPVVPFEEVEKEYPSSAHAVYVAVVYTQMNRLRARLMASCRGRGYALASFVSPRAFVWPNVKFGEHCFIFENNVIQPFVTVGNNVVMWSGNHIGHHSRVDDNAFISSHVVISGFCSIGANSFLGVNSATANNVTLGKDCWIGPGVVLAQNIEDGRVCTAPAAEVSKAGSLRLFHIKE
jgi:sugar O-acyltransferase (sialic acid O-acetyltransferase NeuD family)